ncbi:MAG: hypothetical protein KDC80_11045 [Saprospiraceae bacterium]|nr:hypothetical protein [Saprospiraceae bacterium]
MKCFFTYLFPVLMILNCSLFSQNPLEKSFHQLQQKVATTQFHLPWVSLGPVVNSARVEALQIDPHNPGTFYVAFGSGNLWKSIDHGISWKPVFENKPSHGIGDIALAPSDSRVIYLGTGESLRKQRNFTLPGNGIYRSDDGGNTWDHRGLSENWHVGEIAVHPQDPDIVFVAAMGKFWSESDKQGIYKSINGGKDWKKVLYVDEKTRANDIVISHTNPDIIYATMWENNIDTILPESVYGPNSGIYRSEDGGEHWIRRSAGLPSGSRTGRIGVAVSFQDPDIAYALVDNLNKERSNAAEVYRTEDAGISWLRTHPDDLTFSSTIGWYFSDIYVNPRNDQEIYALGVRIAHSEDGGKTFRILDGAVQHINPSPAQTLHLDHCEMWISEQNPNQIAVGNDGGFYLSYNGGDHWMHYNNIPAGEFYTITVEKKRPHRIFGGTQDDATVFGPAEEAKAIGLPDKWQYLWIDAWSGGDGCITQLDPDDPDIIYFSMQEGFVMRKDQKSGTAVPIKPLADSLESIDLRYNFVSPYFVSPHQGQTLYHAGNYIFKSQDRGDNWKRISPDLSVSASNAKRSLAASAFVESPLKAGQLFAGTDHGAFWFSPDDGMTWQERSEGLADGYVRSICPSKFNPNRVYLTMTGLDYDDLNAYAYRSEDQGAHWQPITSGLPDQPVNVIIEDRYFKNFIYAGTHRGVFISRNGGEIWELLGSDFPYVPVADLAINEQDELIVATHGRGIYKIDLSSIYFMFNASENRSSNDPFLFPILDFPAGKLRTSHRDVDQASVQNQNFSFYLPKKNEVGLQIKDDKMEVIWEKKIEGKKGINVFRFDQVLENKNALEPYVLQSKVYIRPGQYKLWLTVGSFKLERAFTVHE